MLKSKFQPGDLCVWTFNGVPYYDEITGPRICIFISYDDEYGGDIDCNIFDSWGGFMKRMAVNLVSADLV